MPAVTLAPKLTDSLVRDSRLIVSEIARDASDQLAGYDVAIEVHRDDVGALKEAIRYDDRDQEPVLLERARMSDGELSVRRDSYFEREEDAVEAGRDIDDKNVQQKLAHMVKQGVVLDEDETSRHTAFDSLYETARAIFEADGDTSEERRALLEQLSTYEEQLLPQVDQDARYANLGAAALEAAL